MFAYETLSLLFFIRIRCITLNTRSLQVKVQKRIVYLITVILQICSDETIARNRYLHAGDSDKLSLVINMTRGFYLDVYTILNRIQLTIWTICAFRVLNPYQ